MSRTARVIKRGGVAEQDFEARIGLSVWRLVAGGAEISSGTNGDRVAESPENTELLVGDVRGYAGMGAFRTNAVGHSKRVYLPYRLKVEWHGVDDKLAFTFADQVLLRRQTSAESDNSAGSKKWKL